MRRLQSVENAAARLITDAPRTARPYHIDTATAPLATKLPIRRHVDFKIAILVFQCLTGQAPGYLTEDCQLVADVIARRLRLADIQRPVSRALRLTSSATDASQLPVHDY